MLKKKLITAAATGALLISSLTPLAFADTAGAVGGSLTNPVGSLLTTATGLVQGVVSEVGSLLGGVNASASVNNQTSVSAAGANAQTSTGATAQLKP